MSRSIFGKIYPKRTLDRVDRKVKLMGVDSHIKALTILNLRVFISLLLFVIILLISNMGYVLAPIMAILFYYISEIILLDYPIKKIARKLESESLFFL